ncbi:MAG: ATP-binding cassette domain-containing protein [Firmicutes bacterium]|nr:ATP-binding cassette domain-containing protein [Bacillota bacterium]
MEQIIKMENVSKEFKILKRREGIKGSIRDLFSRDYQILKAVNDVTVDIMPGEMVGYLGPNGAGKSTTIKMMTGVLEPTKGQIFVNGRVPYENRTRNAQDIGVVFGQRSQLWWALPVIESFRILKEIYQISDREFNDNLEYYDALVGASELYHKPVRQMSLGQRTLCDILAAFLHNPGIVFMDEPTIGLDVSMKSKIRELVGALNKEKGTTIILTTHDMGDVDALCRRIIIIDKGRMIYDNDIEHLRGFFGAYRTIRIQFDRHAQKLDDEVLKHQADEVEEWLRIKFPHAQSIAVSTEEQWIQILINEDEIHMMEAVNCIQEHRQIADMNLQEISTESVIRKIYEGGIV